MNGEHIRDLLAREKCEQLREEALKQRNIKLLHLNNRNGDDYGRRPEHYEGGKPNEGWIRNLARGLARLI